MPALLTRTSSLPKRSQASSTKGDEVVAPRNVSAGEGRLTAGRRYASSESLQPVQPAGAKHELRSALGEQERGRLADAAAGAGDGDDLAVDSRHAAYLLFWSRANVRVCPGEAGRRRPGACGAVD